MCRIPSNWTDIERPGAQSRSDVLSVGSQPPQPTTAGPAPVKRNERVSVYWTEDKEWYTGTFTASRIENADGGGTQRSCCIVYDAVGPWASCSRAQLTYWHCLDDEKWERVCHDA